MAQLRPVEHLHTIMKRYPQASQFVDVYRAGRGKDLPKWADWCFLPMAAWYSIISKHHEVEKLPLHLAGEIAKVAALGTWRYSQGIYTVDANLLNALTESDIPDILPADVLTRLPEWCIYLDTPHLQWGNTSLHGFWTHLEWDANTGRTELRFLLDCDDDLIGLPLHLGNWSLKEAVERAVSEAEKNAGTALADSEGHVVTHLAGAMKPLISILLYLCSEAPDVENDQEPGSLPGRPALKKVKQGWKLFPAEKHKFWTVGKSIGKQLREAVAAGGEAAPGRSVKTHLRRGHWHGYWKGSRSSSSERTFHYYWLSPLVVSGREKVEE